MKTVDFANSGMRQCITYLKLLFQKFFVQWIASKLRFEYFQHAKSSVSVCQIQLRPSVSGIMQQSDATIRTQLLCRQLLEKTGIFYDVNHNCAKIRYFCKVMRKFCLKIPVIFILFFAGALNLHAQNVSQTDWTQALDRYEQICNQCISLRDDIQNGVQVPATKVSSLLQEIARLRAVLQNASGSMTNGQKRRFSEIRDRYQTQLDGPVNQKDAISKPASKPSVILQHPPKFVPLDMEIAELDFSALVEPLTIPDSLSFPYYVTNDFARKLNDPVVLSASELQGTTKLKGKSNQHGTSDLWRIHVMGMIDFGKVTQYGMILAVGMKKYGLLIGGVSNFHTVQPQYDCYKDGSINGGGYFWGDGSVADTRCRLIAGLYWSPIDKLLIYANSGFSSVNHYWHDTQDQWARVIDLSGRGALAGAGIIVPLGHVSLASGIQYDCFTKSVTANAGVGFNFSFRKR